MSAVPIEKRNVSKQRREKIIARQDGVCKRAYCEDPATDVDHIIPLWCGGSNLDTNLEGLCHPCHLQKTKSEAKARAKAKRIEKKFDPLTRKPSRMQSRGFRKDGPKQKIASRPWGRKGDRP